MELKAKPTTPLSNVDATLNGSPKEVEINQTALMHTTARMIV